MEENKKTAKEIMAENLKYYLKRAGKSQTDLAKDLNIPEMTVSNWVKAKTYPRVDKIQLMADYFNIYRSDLTEETTEGMPSNLKSTNPKIVKIPILGKIACGDPIYAEENFDGYREEIAEFVPSGKIMFLETQGDSMEPTIPNGAWVMIRKQPDVENGEIAAVRINGNEEATLKRIVKQDGLLVLMPDNPKHKPLIVNEQNPAYIIGKAVKFSQDL